MKDLKITRGEWQFENYAGYMALQNDVGYHAKDILNADSVGSFEAEHNAELCCDAGNTAQKCGFLPSELLKQNEELREALIKYDEWVFENGKAFADTKESVDEYIEYLKNVKK